MTYQQLNKELDKAWDSLMDTAAGSISREHFKALIRDLEARQEALPIDQQH